MLPSGTKRAWVRPYFVFRPGRQVIRVRHSGYPANENAFTFFMSGIVFTLSFFAVFVSRPNESVSEKGVIFSTVACRSPDSNFFAAAQVATAVAGSGCFAI